ncbi:MAG: hypothetical protein KME21_28205 [Desmonostoc vinosum HA7617-LM4]|jgi:hypothetical protein|nr:hypothetical protein [Desmonostoc vinosum HA7617-LM4]
MSILEEAANIYHKQQNKDKESLAYLVIGELRKNSVEGFRYTIADISLRLPECGDTGSLQTSSRKYTLTQYSQDS